MHHDLPKTSLESDERITFQEARFPIETEIRLATRDKHRKRRYAASIVRDWNIPPCLFYFLDADDLAHRTLVARLRERSSFDAVLVRKGWWVDQAGNQAQIRSKLYLNCGSTNSAKLASEDLPLDDSDRNNLFGRLLSGKHQRLTRRAYALGKTVGYINFPAIAYTVNHSESLRFRKTNALRTMKKSSYLTVGATFPHVDFGIDQPFGRMPAGISPYRAMTLQGPYAPEVIAQTHGDITPSASDRFLSLCAKSRVFLEYGSIRFSPVAAVNGVSNMFSVVSDADLTGGTGHNVPLAAGQNHTSLRIRSDAIRKLDSVGEPDVTSERHHYPVAVWHTLIEKGLVPDLIVIDGNFKTAPFLTSLLLAAPGTIILLNTQKLGSHLKALEALIAPASNHGEFAEFIVPVERDESLIYRTLSKYWESER